MLHEFIKQHLDENGIKYAFVAEEIGVAKSVFSSMMNGKRKITGEEFCTICDVVKTDTNYFAEKLKEAG